MFSVVINTRNEIRHIAGCIDSVRALADDIVVCDMHSEDGTAAAARARGARVIDHPICRFVEPARHTAISAAREPWVLVIDADERLTPSLSARLKAIAQEGRHPAVAIASLTQFAGQWLRHGPTGCLRTVRCFQKQVYLDTYSDSELQIHENFKSLRGVPGLIELDLSTPLLHLAYPSLPGLLMKQALYAREDALKRFHAGERGSFVKLVRRVLERARKALIRQQAWKDGLAGWSFTAVMCVYEAASALRLIDLQQEAAAVRAATAVEAQPLLARPERLAAATVGSPLRPLTATRPNPVVTLPSVTSS